MPNKKGLQTKKELKRYKKSELIQHLGGDKSLKKMSKNALVDMAFKNKKIRAMAPKEKRKMSEKQKANLQKWRIGKDYKHEKTIKPKSTYVAEIRKIEDTENIGRGQPNEFKGQKKIGEGSGRFQETQVEELKQQAKTNRQMERVRGNELATSTIKTSDQFDRNIDEHVRKREEPNVKRAIHNAKHKKDVRFGDADNEAQPNPSKDTIFGLMNTPANEVASRLTLLKKKNPNDPMVVILEQLLQKKKSQ